MRKWINAVIQEHPFSLGLWIGLLFSLSGCALFVIRVLFTGGFYRGPEFGPYSPVRDTVIPLAVAIAVMLVAVAMIIGPILLIVVLYRTRFEGRGYFVDGFIIFPLLFATFFWVVYTSFKVKDKNIIGEAIQGMHSIQLSLDRFELDQGYLPRFPDEVNGLVYEGYLDYYPRNQWAYNKLEHKDYTEFLKAALVNVTPRPPDIPEMFGPKGGTMANMCMGYEVGKDLLDWPHAYPWRFGEPLERRYTRQVLCGNFLYIPLDKGKNPLPYDTPKDAHVAGYFLAVYGSPLADGLDAWTPTGDPIRPIALSPDGIRDGVIAYVISGFGKAESKTGERRR